MNSFLTFFLVFLALFAMPTDRIRGDVDSVFFSPFRIIGKRAQVLSPAYDDLGEYLVNPDFV
ncbi:Protein CBG25453 [Caenorhabditis briggsae]|uniref:Protein CBG25453 n=1 Tax=Caenorhabditis briggsae TaxID=6238 RepID=B6IES3_CAEBR|nr:Protein CBG25453 [Caenorhabditis briggsae]CAR98403.1 Protein CBG25453 [Caenorhabditis briggsae]